MHISALIIFTVAVAIILPSISADGLGFPSHWRAKDLKTIFSNDNLLEGQVKCVLREGTCTPDGKIFRNAIPRVLETACSICTEEEKKIIRIATLAMHKRDPDTLKKMQDIYDKDEKYTADFIKFLVEE